MTSLHLTAAALAAVTAAFAGGIGVVAWRRRPQHGAVPLVVMAVGAAGWAGSAGVSALLREPTTTRVVGYAIYPFATVAAAGWLLFALAYTGRRHVDDRRVAGALAGVVGLEVAVIATNRSHHAFAAPVADITRHGFLQPVPGPLYWVHMALTFGAVLAGLGILLAELPGARGVYRQQTLALVGGGLLPVGLTAVEVFDLFPIPGFGVGVLGLTLGALVVLWTLFYADFLEVVPIHRDRLMEQLDDAIIALDQGDRLVDCNREATATFGVAEDALGDPLETAFDAHPELVDAVAGTDEGTVAVTLETAAGHRYYEVRVSPVRTDRPSALGGPGGGGVVGRIVALRDTTARRERIRRLKQFRSVVETARDPIFVLGGDDTVELVNEAMARFLDRPRTAVVGEPVRSALPASAAEGIERMLQALRAGERHAGVFEFEATGEDGRPQSYEVHLGCITAEWSGEAADSGDTSEGAAGAVGIVRDVTDHEERKAELDLLSQILTRVLRHNIRNDLNVISGNAEVLAKRLDGREARMAEQITETARTVTDLADNAHTAHRITTADTTTAVLDLHRAVEVAVASVTRDHPAATVSVAVADCEVVAIRELEIAIEHLVENAIVHSDRPEPTVTVRATVDDEWVAVQVEDDGPGIDISEVAALQRDRETDLRHASGLGLWIVTWIVEQSGGTLEFDSDGDGTTVTLTLARPGGPAAAQPEATTGGGEHREAADPSTGSQ